MQNKLGSNYANKLPRCSKLNVSESLFCLDGVIKGLCIIPVSYKRSKNYALELRLHNAIYTSVYILLASHTVYNFQYFTEQAQI